MLNIIRTTAFAISLCCWSAMAFWHWTLERSNICAVRYLAPLILPDFGNRQWHGLAAENLVLHAFALAILVEVLRYPAEIVIEVIIHRAKALKSKTNT